MTAPSRDHGAADLNAAQSALDGLARERAGAPSPDDLRAQLAAVTAERDALRVIVEGRLTPPTPEEIAAHAPFGGTWAVTAAWFASRTPMPDGPLSTPGRAESVANNLARGEPAEGYPQRWVPIDREGRPCAWPTVTP